MIATVHISTIYECPLERAFKTPILCDVRKVHTGLGPMPKVLDCRDDAGWGQPGSSKKIIIDKTFMSKGGFGFIDKVLEREENKYWVLELSDFQMPMFGLTRFRGKWKTTAIDAGRTRIDYSYQLHSGLALLYPFHWLFAQTLWRIYMWQVVENIRKMAYAGEPYMYP
jgi:hypothetical protein